MTCGLFEPDRGAVRVVVSSRDLFEHVRTIVGSCDLFDPARGTVMVVVGNCDLV